MTNRLNILERERERLREALSDDPHWQAFCDARPDAAVRISLQGISQADAEALAGNQLFVSYIAVVDEMARLTDDKTAFAESSESAGNSAFRTRVNLKPPPLPDMTTMDAPSDRKDDLTAIRRIDRKLAHELNALDVFSFETMAGWDRHEVRRIRDALNLGKRIWRENWIEQAALLQMKYADRPVAESTVAAVPNVEMPPPLPSAEVVGPTGGMPLTAHDSLEEVAALPAVLDDIEPGSAPEPEFAQQPADLIVLDEPAELVGPPAVALRTDLPALQQSFKVGRRPRRLPAPAARRFAYIRGVSDELADALRGAGIKSIADIASWSRADVRWFRAILGENARISQDQWIEQATLLAQGIWTNFALRVVAGETRLLVTAPEPVVAVVPAAQNIGGIEEVAPIEPPVVIDQETAKGDADVSTHAEPGPIEDDLVESVVQEMPDEPATVRPISTERFNPLRGLTTVVALGKIKRPPPDLGAGHRIAEQPIVVEPSKWDKPAVPLFDRLSAARPDPQSTPDDIPAPIDAADDELTPTEPIDFDAENDWDDAEALVIRKAEEAPSSPEVPLPSNSPSIEPPPRLSKSSAVIDENDVWVDDESVAPWSDEAEVMIVSQPRAQEAGNESRPAPAASVAQVSPRPMREPKDDRPEFITRRMQDTRDVNDYDEASASFLDATEEATVTIIRAESSETDAASILPNEIANDADAPIETREPTRKPKARRFGSRFLKALTGD